MANEDCSLYAGRWLRPIHLPEGDRANYSALRRAYAGLLQPVGVYEKSLATAIAENDWHQNRSRVPASAPLDFIPVEPHEKRLADSTRFAMDRLREAQAIRRGRESGAINPITRKPRLYGSNRPVSRRPPRSRSLPVTFPR